jgi:hypothetical protein
LQPIDNKVPDPISNFPMNFIINTIPKKAELTKRPDPSNELAYGKYLITAASCAECHTPFEKGQSIKEFAYSGGREFNLPAGIVTTCQPHSRYGNRIRQMDKATIYRSLCVLS